ncbi:hypothetical protein NI17_015450 [Thermobifida halotolerans]|uniref:Uncharacterized protein n=1 Tax=Thermobifida halotolerans TaxID=483545 RepID=A0A399G3H1_9ACTN|nr:hypothetical protein [Thermobifida halotolerans]UOE18232.1 hypothetical protein NI17_015450 [Thermobifida halotolerans]
MNMREAREAITHADVCPAARAVLLEFWDCLAELVDEHRTTEHAAACWLASTLAITTDNPAYLPTA